MRSAGVVTRAAAAKEKWLLFYDELKARLLIHAPFAQASPGRAARILMKNRSKNNTALAGMNNRMRS